MSWDIFQVLTDWAVGDRGEEIFGRKPEVADYKPVDAGEEAGRAVKSNIANIGDIQVLLERILPGYKNIVGQESENIQSLLRGEIPKDLQDSLRRTSAFKAFQGGYGGSGMSRALTARDFGKTSIDLMERGGNAAQRWMQTTQNSVAPFMVTAPMQTEVTGRNNLYDQATQQFRFNVEAAPNPVEAGKFNLQTAMGSMAASFGMSSALGGQGASNATAARQPVQNTPPVNYNPNAYFWGGWG